MINSFSIIIVYHEWLNAYISISHFVDGAKGALEKQSRRRSRSSLKTRLAFESKQPFHKAEKELIQLNTVSMMIADKV